MQNHRNSMPNPYKFMQIYTEPVKIHYKTNWNQWTNNNSNPYRSQTNQCKKPRNIYANPFRSVHNRYKSIQIQIKSIQKRIKSFEIHTSSIQIHKIHENLIKSIQVHRQINTNLSKSMNSSQMHADPKHIQIHTKSIQTHEHPRKSMDVLPPVWRHLFPGPWGPRPALGGKWEPEYTESTREVRGEYTESIRGTHPEGQSHR